MGSGRSNVGTEGADDSVGIEKVEVEFKPDLIAVLESSSGGGKILTNEHMCRCGCVCQITYLLRKSRLPRQQDRLVS